MSSESTAIAKEKLRKVIAVGLSKHHSELNDEAIHSVGGLRSYVGCISRFLEWRLSHLNTPLPAPISTIEATFFLDQLSVKVEQSTLNQYHNALQMVIGARLPRYLSDIEEIRTSRAILANDLHAIVQRMSEKHAFATMLLAHSGMRASEIYELRFEHELEPSKHRQWNAHIFAGRGHLHKMILENAKGGLHRAIGLNEVCFEKLIQYKLPEKKLVVDRGVNRFTWFDLPGGQRIAQSFSDASAQALQVSVGVHGLRHSNAQSRYAVLRNLGYSHTEALNIVTQELGHFSPAVTMNYYRKG